MSILGAGNESDYIAFVIRMLYINNVTVSFLVRDDKYELRSDAGDQATDGGRTHWVNSSQVFPKILITYHINCMDGVIFTSTNSSVVTFLAACHEIRLRYVWALSPVSTSGATSVIVIVDTSVTASPEFPLSTNPLLLKWEQLPLTFVNLSKFGTHFLAEPRGRNAVSTGGCASIETSTERRNNLSTRISSIFLPERRGSFGRDQSPSLLAYHLDAGVSTIPN
ncbi:1438_t:CDS:2 [Acaulospora morrowiae]|uniref:1438_t:CDS:1 n=1 Tax=Acaulospora morrowiae TaxID=94023 RepID=A0A9N9BR28_9GLOM|nr:1438_t:CDS:2 [Acaulospora morrowiae]